ncbi:tRNA epoxyqueuosine(34) reductase QueG, partial [Streptococcus danieliae]|nr:tRNA epoxyqueuosine(34) reductase QueG [Streptococcus danieliae]
LGELVTNLEIEPDQPVPNGCGDCTRCLTSCPTSCLLGDGTMNAKRCLSFQTQDKGMMDLEFRKKIKTVIYGCDICQISCPYNKGILNQAHTEIDPELAQPQLLPFLELSNGQFKEKFGHVAGSWRGKNILQRNAIIALANSRDRSAIPKLLEIIDKSQNKIHVATAIWAIGQIVPQPNPEMITFIETLTGLDEDGQAEQARLLNKWQVATD